MATFKFKTKNAYIDGKIEYAIVDRNNDGYTVNYTIYLSRNNSWQGTHTHGYLYCYVYANSSNVGFHSHNVFNVYNKKNGVTQWYSPGWGSYKVSLNGFQSATHTIGIRMVGAVEGLKADYQEESYTVGAYSTKTGKSTIDIMPLPDNKFEVICKTGNNGDYNKAVDCRVYGHTDGTEPSWDSTNSTKFSYSTGKTAGNTHRKVFEIRDDISTHSESKGFIKKNPKNKVTTVWLKPYTIGEFNNGYSNNNDSDSVKVDIYFYEPPKWSDAPTLTTANAKEKPTYRTTYKVDWTDKVTPKNDKKIWMYEVSLYKQNNEIAKKQLLPDGKGIIPTSCTFNPEDLTEELRTNDEIKAKVIAYDEYNDGTDLTSTSECSNIVTIVPSGVMNISLGSSWVEGQTYIYDGDTWQEATGVYIYDGTSWQESI